MYNFTRNEYTYLCILSIDVVHINVYNDLTRSSKPDLNINLKQPILINLYRVPVRE